MAIIDIHTHILYGIDDGATDLEMSLRLLDMEYDQGVRGIFLTNHSYGMEEKSRLYHVRFDEIAGICKERYPDLKLYKGCEILCYRDEMDDIFRNIEDGIFPTMNGTKYILMEFDPHYTDGMDEMTYCAKYALDKGYIPILAHVERYKSLYDEPLSDLKHLKDLGCKVQINLYSVEQDKGTVGGGSRKELANLFLKHKLVDFVGTDTHNLNYKSPEAAVGAKALREKYGDEYADIVLHENIRGVL